MRIVITPSISSLSILIGNYLGIFKKNNIDLEIIPSLSFSTIEKKLDTFEADGGEVLYSSLLAKKNFDLINVNPLIPIQVLSYSRLAFYSPKNFLESTIELKSGLISPIIDCYSPEKFYLDQFLKRLFPNRVDPVFPVTLPFNLLEVNFFSRYSLGMVGDSLIAPFLYAVKNSYNVKEQNVVPYSTLTFHRNYLLANIELVNKFSNCLSESVDWILNSSLKNIMDITKDVHSQENYFIYYNLDTIEKIFESRGIEKIFSYKQVLDSRKYLIELMTETNDSQENLTVRDEALFGLMEKFKKGEIQNFTNIHDLLPNVKPIDFDEFDLNKNLEKYRQQLYKVLFKNSHEPLLIFDQKTLRIEDTSNKFREEMGFSLTEIAKLTIPDIMNDFSEMHPIRHFLQKPERSKYISNIGLNHRDNLVLNMDLFITQIQAGNESKYIINFLNHSEKKDAMRLKHEFISNISHELRTPMTSIQGFFELLSSDRSINYSAEHHGILEIINKNIKKMKQLIENLLLLEKKENKKENKIFEKFNPLLVIEEIIEVNLPAAKEKSLEIRLDLSKDILLELNRFDFMQIMSNLIVNAIKYTEKGSVSISLGKEEVNNLCKILIVDTGIGIEKKYFLSIFERFFRIPGVYSKKVGGTGIGLAVTQELLSKMGGIILLDSELGKGSTFTVYLPMVF